MLNAKQLKRIAEATEVNDHGKALALKAAMLGREDLYDQVIQIRKDHMDAGYLTPALMTWRDAVAAKIDAHAKQVLTPEQYATFKAY